MRFFSVQDHTRTVVLMLASKLYLHTNTFEQSNLKLKDTIAYSRRAREDAVPTEIAAREPMLREFDNHEGKSSPLLISLDCRIQPTD